MTTAGAAAIGSDNDPPKILTYVVSRNGSPEPLPRD